MYNVQCIMYNVQCIMYNVSLEPEEILLTRMTVFHWHIYSESRERLVFLVAYEELARTHGEC